MASSDIFLFIYRGFRSDLFSELSLQNFFVTKVLISDTNLSERITDILQAFVRCKQLEALPVPTLLRYRGGRSATTFPDFHRKSGVFEQRSQLEKS